MPYYRNFYHVVRPDDPIAVQWRPPEVSFEILLVLNNNKIDNC